jgi:hypothetical protein
MDKVMTGHQMENLSPTIRNGQVYGWQTLMGLIDMHCRYLSTYMEQARPSFRLMVNNWR